MSRANLQSFKMEIEDLRKRYNIDTGKLQSAQERIGVLRTRRAECEEKDMMYREELAVILSAGARQLQLAAENLASAANYSIQTVFGSDYHSLAIEADATGSAAVANITLYKYEGGELYPADPYEDNGGGVNDVASALLKLGALVGYEPTVQNALLCDEPSKHVSGKYREGLAKVFRDMSHNTGRQIIMSTHDPAMAVASDNLIQID